MKKILILFFSLFIGYSVFSQNVTCPIQLPEITIPYSKPLVLDQLIDTLFVCDPDVGQTHEWSITSDPSGFWSVLPTNLLYPKQTYIRVKSTAINADNKSSYDITVRVTDKGNFTTLLSQDVIIHLVESNGEPVIAANQLFTIDENLPASTLVGKVLASDPDVLQTLTYSITSGNDNGLFIINSATGDITTTGILNHEGIDSYALVIKVTDSGTTPKSDSETIIINVIDVNERPVIYR